MSEIDKLLYLSRSKSKSSFKLKGKELEYFESKGIDEILKHARDMADKSNVRSLGDF